jgi:hypothetical protein
MCTSCYLADSFKNKGESHTLDGRLGSELFGVANLKLFLVHGNGRFPNVVPINLPLSMEHGPRVLDDERSFEGRSIR